MNSNQRLLASIGWAIRLVGGVGLASGFGSAVAQEAPTAGLEEIVVIAQKRSENSQDVPIAVSAVSGTQLQASGVSSILQLTTLDPALQIQNEVGSMETRIRGVGTTSNGPAVENPVALYVDGVYYASQVTGGVNIDSVSQISVLKGPQGTLFGRNATGGVIQITTKDPTNDFHMNVNTDLDNYLTSRTNFYVTGGVSDNLATNLSALYAFQEKGYGTNFYTGRDDVHKLNHEVQLRNKWLFTPSEDTSVKVVFDYTDRTDNNGLNIVPFPGTAQFALVPGYRPSSNPWDTDIHRTATDDLQSGGASVQVQTALPFARLESVSAYRQFIITPRFSSTASPTPGDDLKFPEAGTEATEELQLVSLDSSAIKWAAGVYYFYDRETTGPGVNINELPPTFGPTVTSVVINSATKTNSVAGFGQATAPVPLIDNTNITAGIRYTYERRQFTGDETVNGFSIPLPPIAPEITAKKPTWRLSLDHKFQPDLLGYVSYNRGFKSGGYNGFDPTNPPYGPEQVDAYEAGLKSEFLDHTLRVNAAAFYNKYNNIQVSRYTNTAVIYNGARAEIEGLELSVEKQFGNLQIGGGLEELHSKFTSFANASCSVPNYPAPGLTLFSCSATGNKLPYAPQTAITLTADYSNRLPVGSLNYNLTNYYNSGYFVEPNNLLRQDAYDTVNAAITWKSENKRFYVKLYATNLLNKAVYSFAGTNSTQYTADYGNPPRLVGIKLSQDF